MQVCGEHSKEIAYSTADWKSPGCPACQEFEEVREELQARIDALEKELEEKSEDGR